MKCLFLSSLSKIQTRIRDFEAGSTEMNLYGSICFWNLRKDTTLGSYPQKPALLMYLCCRERQWAGIYSWHISIRWVINATLFQGRQMSCFFKGTFLKTHQFFWGVLVGFEQRWSLALLGMSAEKRV